MKKKIIAATMAAAMCVSLAACGGSTASSSAAESTASSTAESTASSTADAASTGDEEVDLRMASIPSAKSVTVLPVWAATMNASRP